MRGTLRGIQIMVAALVLRIAGEVVLVVRWIRLRPWAVEPDRPAALSDVEALDRLQNCVGGAVLLSYLLIVVAIIFLAKARPLAGDRPPASTHSRLAWTAAICFMISVSLFSVGAVTADPARTAAGDTAVVVKVTLLRTGADLFYAAVPFLLVLGLSQGWRRTLLVAGLVFSAAGRAAYSLPDLFAPEGSLTLADLEAFIFLPAAILGYALYALVYANLARSMVLESEG